MSLIGWENHIETGTLSTDSETTAGPVANLQNDVGAIQWVTSGTSAYVRIDAGSVVTWRMAGVFRTNFTTAATVRFKLGTSAGGTDVYDSGSLTGVVAGYNQLTKDLGQDYSARYAEIAIADSTNPDGALFIGLAYFGTAWSSESMFGVLGRDEDTEEVVSEGGQEFPRNKWNRRVWEIGFESSAADAMNQIFELDRISRQGGNSLFIPFPGGEYQQKEAVFGRVRGQRVSFPNRNASFRAWQGRIAERL